MYIPVGSKVTFQPRRVSALHVTKETESQRDIGLLSGTVVWCGTLPRPDGSRYTAVDVNVLGPDGRSSVWMSVEVGDCVHVTKADGNKMMPGSYGDHGDPRGAMRRLVAARESVGGKKIRIKKAAEAALSQLEAWFDDPAWTRYVPDGHYLGRHTDNILDVGIWPIERQ